MGVMEGLASLSTGAFSKVAGPGYLMRLTLKTRMAVEPGEEL